jgi:K(+)-stimulated pyrophosphate-energized sodium pump
VVKATPYVPKPDAGESSPVSTPPGATLSVNFASGKYTLDAEAVRILKGFAPAMKAGANPIYVTGFADRTGDHAANVELATRRATAVRDALVVEGIAADRIRLKAPQDVTGPGSDREARRVDNAVGK